MALASQVEPNFAVRVSVVRLRNGGAGFPTTAAEKDAPRAGKNGCYRLFRTSRPPQESIARMLKEMRTARGR